MQFLFSPVLGALSDRFGRRPVILLSNFGLGLDYVLMALAPSLCWLFVGRVISGITAASISTAFAYIADVTPPERRAARVRHDRRRLRRRLRPRAGARRPARRRSIRGCRSGSRPRFSLANALYGLFVLPESLPPERRARVLAGGAPIRSARSRCCARTANCSGWRPSNFLANLAHVVLPSVFVLYASYRYGWDERTVGLTLAVRRRLRDDRAGAADRARS